MNAAAKVDSLRRDCRLKEPHHLYRIKNIAFRSLSFAIFPLSFHNLRTTNRSAIKGKNKTKTKQKQKQKQTNTGKNNLEKNLLD